MQKILISMDCEIGVLNLPLFLLPMEVLVFRLPPWPTPDIRSTLIQHFWWQIMVHFVGDKLPCVSVRNIAISFR